MQILNLKTNFKLIALLLASAFMLIGCNQKPAQQSIITTLPVVSSKTLVLDSDTLSSKTKNFVVPKNVIIKQGGLEGVYVLSETNSAQFRMVRLGKHIDNKRIEVLSGLNKNEQLLTSHLNEMVNGSPIKIIQ